MSYSSSLSLSRKDSGVPQGETLAGWLMGAFDALEKNYLRELIFLVYLDPTKPQVIYEKFTFSFSYAEGAITMDLGKNSSSGKVRKEVKMEDLKGDTQALLRQIAMVTQGLGKLPEEAYLAVKLTYYDDITPVDYEPKGFGADHTTEEPMPSGAYRISLGKVETGFHAIRVKMDSRQQGSGESYVNDTFLAESQSQSQQFSGETPVESGGEFSQSPGLEEEQSQDMEDQHQQDTQMSEKILSFSQPDSPASTISLFGKVESLSPSPAPVVSCICESSSLDPLMLKCNTCSTFQHATCYRVLSEEELPAIHTCWSCSKANPGLVCTDPKMDKFYGRENLAAPTCLFRRVLVLLWRSEGNHITTDIIQSTLLLFEDEVTRIMERLFKEMVVTEFAGNLLINKEALKKTMKTFGINMTIKSTSVTRANSAQRTVSKRKEERMAKGDEARELESRKKKSRISDLQF